MLLSNVPHAVTTQAVPDDIDIIAIGPSGLHIIEVKHWDRSYVKEFQATVTHEADKLCNKVRRIASKLKRANLDAGFLAGKFLLTKDATERTSHKIEVHGCRFFGLKEVNDLLEIEILLALSDKDVERICQVLQPLSKVTLRGEVRSIASARNLERTGDGSDRFHRTFRGEHIRTRDKIILHLYDFSASDDPAAETLARRQFDTLNKLQKSSHVPRLMDSFQEVPQYPGELWYFSIVDPCAPCLADRSRDERWEAVSRIEFARTSVDALRELHASTLRDVQFVHRHITPTTLLVGANDQPIFTEFDLARISGSITLSPTAKIPSDSAPFAAPEAVVGGLGVADQRSDVFSLCKTLRELFKDAEDDESVAALLKLESGMAEQPENRVSLEQLSKTLRPKEASDSGIDSAAAMTTTLAARYWSEGDFVDFNNHQYRIASRIGSGSFGSTFKVIQVQEGQDVGIYAGKVMFERDSGNLALDAYRRVRSHTDQPNLATVFELANHWEDNRFVALLKWVDGNTLQNWIGYPEMYAEELGESATAVVGRWLMSCCTGLSSLHRAGLVHGDVSPKNVLEHAGDVSLVDYDLVLQQGERLWSGGTVLYTPPEYAIGKPASCSHDIYALATTMFHVVFDRDPFWYGGTANAH
ncbi:MAG: NERD domain-containing serine/threonine-protein kinase [Planctomycetota bacterium]|nr:NERD domain-containing serine/threonine-protein kinase [Planctomycetota bacterium]